MATTAKNDQTLVRVSLSVLGVALTGLGGWVWQINQDSRNMVRLTEQLSAVVEDLKDVSDDFQTLDSKVERIAQNVDAIRRLEQGLASVTEWQDDWERDGLLPVDVEQNTKIANLEEDVNRLSGQVRELELNAPDPRR